MRAFDLQIEMEIKKLTFVYIAFYILYMNGLQCEREYPYIIYY